MTIHLHDGAGIVNVKSLTIINSEVIASIPSSYVTSSDINFMKKHVRRLSSYEKETILHIPINTINRIWE